MKLCKQLFTKTTEGKLLISEIKEIIRLGRKDNDDLVAKMFLRLFEVLEALIKSEMTGSEGLGSVLSIRLALEKRVKETCGEDAVRIRKLADKVDQFVIDGLLLPEVSLSSESV
ncbi:hypothetical protein K8S19_09325 [bacterium]|nr:hypothetical protein [bacterium]